MTTPADGAAAAAAFPRGRHILIANGFHVNALPHARSGCAAGIVRHFIATLDPGDTGCASEVPPVRLVPRFVRHADEVDPAVADGGNAASAGALRLASAAVQTVGDIVVRVAGNSSGHGVGLRGGTFEVVRSGASCRITLEGVRWTEDLAVSGTIEETRDAAGTVRAKVTIEGPDGPGDRWTCSGPTVKPMPSSTWRERSAADRERAHAGALNARSNPQAGYPAGIASSSSERQWVGSGGVRIP